LTVVVFPDRSEHRFRHDARGRVVASVDEAGAETRYEWNAVGGATARTAPGSPPERWTYDRVGRAVSHIDRLGNRLALEYDTEGSLTALVNRVGERATFEYNADGRRIRETGFDARSTSYGFDAVGRCTRIDRPGGRSLEARYNLCGEVIWRRPSDGAPETFAYDPDGLLVGAANVRAAVELERDALGRIVAEVQPGGRVEYEFAGLTRMVARRLPGQPGPAAEVRLTYDARGRVAGIADAAGPFQSLRYDAGGRMVERRTPAGFAERCAYDPAGRWQSQEMGGRSRAYEFDARQNLVRTEDGAGTALRYDALDRLVAVGGATDPEAYSYDANGAITGSHRGARDIGPGGRVTAAGPDTYEYDADGCVRRVTGPAGAMDLEYDFDGNLIRAESSGRRSEYAFDALGRRVAKVVDGRRTDFLWSGTMLAAVLPEGEPGEYFLAFDFEPVARWSGGRRLVPTADPTGTVREIWDELGGLVWEGGSEAYGSPKGPTGGPGQTGLRGQYFDAETGFHHHLHRSYDPRIGDFLSPDPIGFEGGVHLYAYPRNPICWDDPLGLDCGGRSPKCTNPNNTVSPRAARRQAAAGAGVPRSQQPAGQRSVKGRVDGKETPAGRQYDYDTPTPGGGAPSRVSVQHSLSDNVPGHGPHWEAGPPKPGGQTDSVGRPRLQNNKVKVDEIPEPNS